MRILFGLILIMGLINLLMAEDIYTTSINIKKITNNRVNIVWKANTNEGYFSIYRNAEKPVANVSILTNSVNLFSTFVKGYPASIGNMYIYSNYIDNLILEGIYYYIVLPKKTNYTKTDFLPNLNYNLSPAKIEIPQVVMSNTNLIVISSNAIIESSNVLSKKMETNTNIVNTDDKIDFIKDQFITKGPLIDKDTNVVMEIRPEKIVEIAEPALFITNIKVKIISSIEVELEWSANTNKGTFLVYRNKGIPIKNLSILSNSVKISRLELKGSQYQNIYQYSGFKDKITEAGYYYYLILFEKTNFIRSDFKANMNFTLSPIIFQTDMDYESSEISINNIFVKKNTKSVLLFWNVSGRPKVYTDYKFNIYKTTNLIEDLLDIYDIPIYKEVDNDFFYEDTDIKYGIPYYYTIILNGKIVLESGKNQMKEPVIFGQTNSVFIIEEEIIKTNVSLTEFQSRFKK